MPFDDDTLLVSSPFSSRRVCPWLTFRVKINMWPLKSNELCGIKNGLIHAEIARLGPARSIKSSPRETLCPAMAYHKQRAHLLRLRYPILAHQSIHTSLSKLEPHYLPANSTTFDFLQVASSLPLSVVQALMISPSSQNPASNIQFHLHSGIRRMKKLKIVPDTSPLPNYGWIWWKLSNAIICRFLWRQSQRRLLPPPKDVF